MQRLLTIFGVDQMTLNENALQKKWTVDELCKDWGNCHRRTVYRTLKRKNAKVVHLAGRLLLPDAEKQRIEDDSTRRA